MKTYAGPSVSFLAQWFPSRRWFRLCASLVVLAAVSTGHALDGVVTGHTADGHANSDGSTSALTAPYGRLGADAGVRHSVIHVFQIPPEILSDPTQRFSAATYSMRIGSGSTMTHNGDLYGLPYRSNPGIQASSFFEGAVDPSSVLLKDNFITPSTPAYSVLSLSGMTLVDYLNAVLDAAREEGAATAYALLRHSLDAYTWSGIYIIGNAEAGGLYLPKLAYTTETVPLWKTVPLGGGGYVTGLVSNADGSAIYCRTDVGGAFRWAPAADGVNGQWISLSDSMMPYGTAKASDVMSVEGIATDPSDLNRLYVTVGALKNSGTAGVRGVFVSNDRGGTWSQIESTIRIDGNEGYRSLGERIAVDPNNPGIVWVGSIRDGLYKGVKSSGSWAWTQIPNSSVPFGLTNAGITFVACDKNNGNTIVYAGVYEAASGGVYRSTDNGATWAKVGGADVFTPRRGVVAANGTLYVTGGTGGVARMDRGGEFVLLSSLPTLNSQNEAVAYHGLAIDPNDPAANIVYVSERRASAGIVLRSADGGTTWANQGSTFNEGPINSTNHVRTEPDGTPTLTGYWFGATSSLLVNPANPNELWLGDFFGVARTRNAQDIGTNPGAWWYMLQKEQEETVVLDLLNAPSGARLLSGLADVGGFRYVDTTVRPVGSGGNILRAPSSGNTTSLDFSEGNPSVWARSWVEQGSDNSPGSGAYSSDGGLTWLPFGQVASRQITNTTAGGWETWDVSTFLAKQKAKGVQVVTFVISSGNTSSYSTQTLSFHSKQADDETVRPQLIANGSIPLELVADTFVNGSAKTTNYGLSKTLEVRFAYTDTVANQKFSYLKFNLGNATTITSAELRLYRLPSTNAISFPVGVYACTNTSWIEGDGGTDNLPAGEMIWNNKPAALSHAGGNPQKYDYYAGNKRLSGGRIAVSAIDPDVLVWAPINAVPYYSNDRGVTWTASTGAPDSQITGVYNGGSSIAISGQPLAADRGNGFFYLAKLGSTQHVIYRSTDAGKTWLSLSSVPNGGSYNMRSPQLVAAPTSPPCPNGGDVWLCDDGIYNGGGGGLWRSIDAALNWWKAPGVGKVSQVSFGKGVAGVGYTVFINGHVNGIKGIYRSDDYGTTWIKLPVPTIKDITALAGDRQNFGTVFFGTGGRGTFVYEGP